MFAEKGYAGKWNDLSSFHRRGAVCEYDNNIIKFLIDKPEAKSQSKAPKSPKKGKRNFASGLVTKILWATTQDV